MALKPNKKGVITGTKNNDKITWTNSGLWKKPLTVNASDGSDVVNFKKSTYKNNKLNGGKGNDKIYGGSNIDIIHGNENNDKLYGYNGNDKLYGDDGNDTLDGGANNDILTGGKGNDKLYTRAGNDTVIFASGDGADILYKGSDSDTLQFNNFKNISTLKKGLKLTKSGNHLVIKYTSKDSVTLFDYFNSGTSVTTLKSKDGKTIKFSDFYSSYIFNTYSGNKITGSALNDIIKGTTKNDTLNGGAGNDKIYGYAGKDYLTGGSGNDYIDGGDGNDTIYGNDGNDTIAAGKGVDTIYTGSGTNTILFNKGDGNDIIYCEGQKTTLKFTNPKAGDWISAFVKKGNDLLVTFTPEGASLSDSETVTLKNYYNSDGTIRNDEIYIQHLETYRLSSCMEGWSIAGVNNVFTGTYLADAIEGSNYNDTICGYGGDDVITGYRGNDILNGGSGNNLFIFNNGDGDDIIENGDGNDNIQFNDLTQELTFTHDMTDNNLVISYSNGDSVTLKDYFVNNSHSVKTINNDPLSNYTDNNIDEIYDYTKGCTIDEITSIDGTATFVFATGTSVYTEHAEDNLIIRCGGNKITVQNYDTEQGLYIKIGDVIYPVEDFELINLSLSRGDLAQTIEINTVQQLNLTLENPFYGENYTYTINSGKSQEINLKYLANGRLRIEGDNLNITSETGQIDDLILWGDNNIVYTNDLDDIIRIGGAVDSIGTNEYDNFLIQGNYNTVNSGTGDDYVVYFGYRNTINAGDGNDLVLSIDGSSNVVNSAYERHIDSNIENSLNGEIEWFNQGTAGGDCRLLSLLQSLSHTLSETEGSYSDYVTITLNGEDYNVTFNNYQGAGSNNITVTSEELSTDFVSGDLDVVITNLALNKLLYVNHNSTVMNISYNTLSSYFFGNSNMTCVLSSAEDYYDKLDELWEKYNNQEINNLEIGISSSNNFELGIVGGHAYTLADLNEEYISLINVWDTADILNLDIETFSGLDTAAFVFGEDIYNQHLTIDNGTGSSPEFNSIMQEVAGWQNRNSNTDIQTLIADDNKFQTDYLAINSIIQEDLTTSVIA